MNRIAKSCMNGLLGLAGAWMAGCTGTEEGAGPSPDGGKERVEMSARVSYGTLWFQAYREYQTDEGTSTEMFSDCPENMVMRGIYMSVNNGNVSKLDIACHTIQPNGNITWGVIVTKPPYEREIDADDGYVITGFGGKVDGSNVSRLVIHECRWIPAIMGMDIKDCKYKSTDNSTATEIFFDTENDTPADFMPWTFLTGIGATSGFEALKVVRATVGTLRRKALHYDNLFIGNERYSFTVPPMSFAEVRIWIGGGTGDADLYVGKGYEPNSAKYDCRPYRGNNEEGCTFSEPGTYHVWINAFSPYKGVSLHADYAKR